MSSIHLTSAEPLPEWAIRGSASANYLPCDGDHEGAKHNEKKPRQYQAMLIENVKIYGGECQRHQRTADQAHDDTPGLTEQDAVLREIQDGIEPKEHEKGDRESERKAEQAKE